MLTFTHTVTNTGATTLSSLAVSQTLAGASTPSCQVATLAPGASTTCTSSYTTTQADADDASVGDTATATASNPQGSTVTAAGAHTKVIGSPVSSVGLATTSPTASYSAAGDVVSYAYLVTNTGGTTLGSIAVSDTRVPGGGVSCPQSSLAPGSAESCTATYSVTQADVDAGSVTDAATATAANPRGTAVNSAPSGATVSASPVSSLGLVATALATSYSTAGSVLAYRYVVTDTGQTTVHGISVDDSRVAGADLTCPGTTLAPGASMTCTGNTVINQADVDAGSISSTSSAAATGPGGEALSSSVSSVTVTSAATPSLSLVVHAGPGGYAHAGDQLTYSYVVVNLSAVTVHAISIGDDHVTAAELSCPQSTLPPLGFEVCTGTYAATAADVTAGSVTNTATANGSSPANTAVASDSSSATVTLTPTDAISLAASSTSLGFTAAGQTVAYHYQLTNTGTAAPSRRRDRGRPCAAWQPVLPPADPRCGRLGDVHRQLHNHAGRRRCGRRNRHLERHRARSGRSGNLLEWVDRDRVGYAPIVALTGGRIDLGQLFGQRRSALVSLRRHGHRRDNPERGAGER